MKVTIERQYLKNLRSVPQYIKIQADEVIKILYESESLHKSGLDYKEMKGGKNKGYYRIRVGTYRIGCYYEHPDIIVITILTRGEIYNNFP